MFEKTKLNEKETEDGPFLKKNIPTFGRNQTIAFCERQTYS